jgi:hypothetical protein
MDPQHAWAELPADKKREQRFQFFTNPKIPLSWTGPEAEAEYTARATRFADAMLLRKTPDRVPVGALAQFYPAHHRAEFTPYDVMYDHEKAAQAWSRELKET